ncbi:MAG: ParB/RepB/Spo0J family partition protein [Nitrospira sp.]|nr:ParB/RepB/Spo0J family partition protein [Nitrospira sp.]MDH4370354.1 ParB/RepB/Spo0J family partition protein [Nitrospira sp.]MDH5346676.1 ParB/RepB/Spo0J family partition protein [Nitrospira sp.]MDH5497424.1 ParB/RepB/Spo0J family partition protein [Nitrospira sp.]MDH5724436.1 ParB/RepB/Spo0J family partition protein [Nitrospira sp.]
MEKKALGKGLGALLPPPKINQPTEGADVQRIRIDAIVPNRYQPRHLFPEDELAELTASIKESGVLQPIVVRRKGDGTYELIAGERRWRASREAGLDTIPVVIKNCTDQESLLLALVENLQREDLNPMETARAYSRMMNEFGLTQDTIALKVGRDRSSVANFVRLTQLHPEIQELVEVGSLSAGHAKAILGLPSPEDQLRVGKVVASTALSVRETEKLVDRSLEGKKRHAKSGHNSTWADLEARLQKRLGTKVTVQPQQQGGKLVIHCFSKEELDGVLEILLG